MKTSTRRQFLTTSVAIVVSTTTIGSEPDPPRDYDLCVGGKGNGERESWTLQQIIDEELEDIQFSIREGHDTNRYPDVAVFHREKIAAVLQVRPDLTIQVTRY